jgi:hypothetical protein
LSESPGQPPVEWFAEGIIDRERKLSGYLLSSTHPDGRNKLRLWHSIFGIDEGDAELLERLIREQLEQATPQERLPKKVMDPDRTMRQWELLIPPRFRGPNSNDGRSRPGGPSSLPMSVLISPPPTRWSVEWLAGRIDLAWQIREPLTRSSTWSHPRGHPRARHRSRVSGDRRSHLRRRGRSRAGLYVEVSRPDGTTIGFTQLEPDEEGAWHVMTYTPFDQANR